MAVPCNVKLYGFSFKSLFAILIIAVLTPTTVGSKVTWKVVLAPGAIVPIGGVVREKSVGFVPPKVTAPIDKGASPVLVIVNVLMMLPVL